METIRSYFMRYERWIYIVLIFLALGSFSIDWQYDHDSLIRFHVIASDNTPKEQRVKLLVKDRIIAYLRPQLEESENIAQSREIIKKNMDQIQNIAQQTLAEENHAQTVRLEYGQFEFPIKYYGSFTLPGGRYEALRVILGEGKGENWWCVMFPPMCFVGASDDMSYYTDCEPQKEIVVKWRLKEWWDAKER